MKPAGELELLDLLVVDVELPRDRLDEESDALGVRARVLVLRVDDADEVLRCAEPRLMLGASLELCRAVSLGDHGAVRAVAVLAVVLRPVQRAVRRALEARDILAWSGYVARPTLTVAAAPWEKLRRRHALVERLDVASRLRLSAREDDSELVTAEAERSDAVRRTSEEPGDLDEHLVSERMPVGVVDPLEVVDVDEAEAEPRAVLCRGVERRCEPELVGAVVADQREAVRVRVAGRTSGCQRGALVQGHGEQRARHEHEEPCVRRPQRRRERGEEGLDREGRPHEPELLLEERENRHPLMERDRQRDEREVDDDEGRTTEEGGERDGQRIPLRRSAEEEHRERGGERGEGVHSGVEDRADQRLALRELRSERTPGSDDHPGVPAEQDDRGEDEDEGEGDGAEVVLLERNRLELGEEREPQEERDRERFRDSGRMEGNARHRPGDDRDRER